MRVNKLHTLNYRVGLEFDFTVDLTRADKGKNQDKQSK